MAKVYISEYSGLGARAQIGIEPVITEYTISSSTVASVTTQAFDAATNLIRVHTDGIVSIAIVATTTATLATINSKRLAADQTEYFGVKMGHHVSVISNS